jgi:aminoglycoside phosphotransferase (APT) family kinase protein
MSDIVSHRILRAAIAEFEKHVIPALGNAKSKMHGDLIYHALKFVETRQLGFAEASSSRAEAAASLASEIHRSLGVGSHKGADGSVNGLIRDLLDIAETPGERRNIAQQLLAKILDQEMQFLAAVDPDSIRGGAACYLGGRRVSSDDVPQGEILNAVSLNRWASENWPAAKDARVVDVEVIPGGFSKTTAFFTLRTADEDRRLVLRRDLPTPLSGRSVITEYPLLSYLYTNGYAIAQPLLVEPRKHFIGGSFLISERMPGSVDFTAWKDDPRQVTAIARQLAQLLARLHSCDPAVFGMVEGLVRPSARHCMEQEIMRSFALYRLTMRDEQPLLEVAFAWLMRNIPEDLADRPACLLHGDAGFHNLLVDQGKVSALLDWEFSHLGDPIEDLCYARMFIEQVMRWKDFLEHYREAGGQVQYPENDDFYALWSATRNPAYCVEDIQLFENASASDITEVKVAVAGYVFGPRLQVDAGRKVRQLILSQRAP